MSGGQALALERLLEGRGFAKKPNGVLLSGLGAKLTRASELPARSGSPTKESVAGWLADASAGKALVELSARRSCGRFSLALSVLAAATSSGQAAALVDLGDHLDPQDAESAGVDLERLLWVRPRRAKEAIAAAEMLLSAGFSLVVTDLGLWPRGARFLPDAAWVRLARASEARGATLLLSTPWRLSGAAARTAVSASFSSPIWQGVGRAPRLLAGLSSRLTLEKDARARCGLREPLALSMAGVFFAPPLRRDSRDAGKTVETRVEAHDHRDSSPLHDGQVQRIPGGEPRVAEHDALGAVGIGELDGEDLVGDAQERIEGGLDRVAPVDGDIAVEDLLEHLGARDEGLLPSQGALEHLLRIPFVGVLGAHQVHRDVRVEKNHRAEPSR
jgi:hypothetical protein